MAELPLSILLNVVVLTVFLILAVSLGYIVRDYYTRTTLLMTLFFLFIVATLTISFWRYTFDTLPYTIPALIVGIIIGYVIGVRAAEERIKAEGLMHYMEHFAHIHVSELKRLTWWSVFNFYSVMGALMRINFVGLTNVILGEAKSWAILTSSVGAFLIGTIVPYLVHIWSIGTRHKRSSTTSEA